MAANPLPISQLEMTINRTATETVVHCTGRITSNTNESLRSTVKPLLAEAKIVVLDFSDVSYMDSSGLGTMFGLYVSAKAAKCQLKTIKLNQRLKELFSLTRLGEVMAEGRDPNDFGIP